MTEHIKEKLWHKKSGIMLDSLSMPEISTIKIGFRTCNCEYIIKAWGSFFYLLIPVEL